MRPRRRQIGLTAGALGAATTVLACAASSTRPGDAGKEASLDASSKDGAVDAPDAPGDADVARPTDSGAKDGRGPDGGPPFLTALSVSSPTGPAPMTPPFSPETFDYYVRCAALTGNALTVSMTASSGSDSSLIGPVDAAAKPTQTVSFHIDADQAIVAVASMGSASTEYWVRCLSPDFPALQMTPHPEAGSPAPGYYLVGTQGNGPDNAGYAMVLDGNGVPVWYYELKVGVFDVDLLMPGTISFDPFPGYPFELHDLTHVPPTTTVIGDGLDPHDLRYLPASGHYLEIEGPIVQGVDLTGLHYQLSDGGVVKLGKNESISTCNIYEIDGAGTVYWEWDALDHFIPREDCTLPEVADRTAPDGGVVIEVFHCNSVDVDPANGNLLVSARNMDSVFYVDRSTDAGAVRWKLGGSPVTKDDATYVPFSGANARFLRQHDGRLEGWTSTCGGEGAGLLSVFDDESGKPGPARGALYAVIVSRDAGTDGCDGGLPEGGVPGYATLAWQYPGAASSSFCGSFRRYDDAGSRLIGWGETPSEGGLVFTEVDLSGRAMLDFSFPEGRVSYRAVKVPLSALDRNILRRSVGLP